MTKLFKQKISNRIVLGKSIIDQAGLGAEVEILVQEGAVLILHRLSQKDGKCGSRWARLGKSILVMRRST